MNSRWRWALIVSLSLWTCYACGGGNGASDYESKLATELERQTVPPGSSVASLTRSEMQPCAIRTQWAFATTWDRATYADWLRAQLTPQFTVLRNSPSELGLSRDANGDTHSLTFEMSSGGDTLRVRVTLRLSGLRSRCGCESFLHSPFIDAAGLYG